MAREIDERIVKMMLENSQFERNAKESLGTLEKLHRGLDFSGASSGLSDLSREVKGFSLEGIASAVESVTSGFSTLGVIGFTALQNITNKAIDTGLALVKSLSTDNIASGWSKLEQKTTSVATLIAQGYDMSTVEEQLSRLNWFTDETSYNFTEMTSNIAKFTASGRGLEESVSAMEGIANWAALSGQNAATASRAMYQLSQAMGAGIMRREDWRSVQTASMDTAEFRQKAIDAAVALGTLKDMGNGKFMSLVGDAEFTLAGFAEGLTEGKWFTSDVMMKVFNDYGSAIEDIYGYTQKYGGTASAAIDALGDSLDEFGLKAFRASQEAKTWTDVVDSVKDAVSTGWMNTFELIFGNYEEQRVLWTDLANGLYDVFAEPGNERNAVLEEAMGSGWSKFLQEGIHDAEAFKDVILETTRSYGLHVDEIIEKSGSFEESLSEGWMTANILKNSLTALTDKTRDLSDEELENLGYTRDQIDALEELDKAVKNGTVNLDEYVDSMNRLSGRQNLVKSLWNAWDAVASIAGPVKEAFREIFPQKTADEVYQFTVKLREFTASLTLSEEAAAKVKTVASGLFNALKFGLGIVKNVLSIAKQVMQRLSPIKDIAVDLLLTVTSMFSSMGKYTSMSEGFSNVLSKILDIIGELASRLYDAYIWLKNFIGQFGKKVDIPGVKETSTALEKIKSILKSIVDFLNAAVGFVVRLFTGINPASFSEAGETILDSLSKGFASLTEKAKEFFATIDVGKVLKSGLAVLATKSIWDFSKNLKSLPEAGKEIFSGIFSDITGVAKNISNALSSVKDTLVSYQKSLNAKSILSIAAAIGVLALSLIALSFVDGDKLTTGLLGMSVVLGEVVATMKALAAVKTKTMTVAAGAIVAFASAMLIASLALKIFASIDSEEMGSALLGAVVSIGILTTAAIVISKFTKAALVKKTASNLITLAISLGAMGLALRAFENLDSETIAKGLGTLGAMLLELMIFSKIVKQNSLKNLSGVLLSMSVAMISVAGSLKILSSIPLENLMASVLALSTVLLTMAGAIAIIGSSEHLLGASVAMLSLANAILLMTIPIVILGNMDTNKLVQGLVAVIAMLAGLTAAAAGLALVSNNIGGLLAASVAIIAISAALTLLAVPITILGNLPFPVLATGLGTLLIALVAFAGISALLAPFGVTLIVVAGAFALFGAAILSIGAGIALLATAFSALVVVGTAGVAALMAALAGILAGLVSLLPKLMEFLGSLILAVCETLLGAIPAISEVLAEILLALIELLVTVGPEFIEMVVLLLEALLTTIADHMPAIIEAGADIIIGFLEGLAEELPGIIDAGVDVILQFLAGVASATADLIDGAFQVITDFFNGLADAIDEHAPDVFDAIGNFAGSLITNLVSGIWSGLTSVVDAVVGLASSAWNSAKEFLGISSPSKKAEWIGQMFDLGMQKGIEELSGSVGDSAAGVGEEASNRLERSLQRFQDIIDGIEAQPHITPVVDLSEVKAKASKVGALFSNSVQVAIGNLQDNVGFTASLVSMKDRVSQDDIMDEMFGSSGDTFYFTQNNYSPKALDRIDIYRQTNNQISYFKEVMSA